MIKHRKATGVILTGLLWVSTSWALAQPAPVKQNFHPDSLLNDQKILLLQKQLPKNWQLRLIDNELYILHPEKVWFPKVYLYDDKVTTTTKSYEYREGIKVNVVESQPCFIFRVEPKWSQAQWKDSVQYNDQQWKAAGLAKAKMKRVPTHMTEKYSLTLLATYNFKVYLPASVYQQMNLISKSIKESWSIVY